jgi:hypothetical protein
MTDNYEQMTDAELQREIAERRGWTEIIFSSPFLVGREPGNIRPNENRYIIPNWPQNANVALELCGESHVCLGRRVTEDDTRWYAMINPALGCQYVGWAEDEHVNPHARAISIASLRWQDAKGGTE